MRRPDQAPISLNQQMTDERGDEVAESVPDSRYGPERQAEQNEEVAAVLTQVAGRSSELEFQVFQMQASGCSYAEMADELCVDEKTVDNAVQRVRSRLRLDRAPRSGVFSAGQKVFSRGRRCVEDGCETVLTVWNPGPCCYLHDREEELEVDDEVGFVAADGFGDMEVIEEAFV